MNLTPPQVNTPIKTKVAVSRYSYSEIVFLLIFVALVGFYLIKPKYAQLTQRQSELKEFQSQLDNLGKKKETINKLYKELTAAENKNAILILDEAIPLDARVTRVYILTENIVKNSGLSLGSLGVEPITSLYSEGASRTNRSLFAKERNLAKYTITMNITGGLVQFLQFLKIIEGNPRIFDIRTMQISGSQDDQNTYALTIDTFAYEEVK